MFGGRTVSLNTPIVLAIGVTVGVNLILPTAATAQSAGEPAAIERTIPKSLPDSRPAVQITAPTQAIAGQNITTGRFTLGAVHIEGATAFTPADLSQYFEPFLATEVDEKTLADIAGRITDHYRRAGYLLSYAMVPPQDVKAGIARIVVVEGRISQVQIEGDDASRPAIEAIARPLIHVGPLRTPELERAIGLIRDFNGVIVSDVSLARSPDDPAQHSLKILLRRDRARALAYLDNRGTDPAGRLRFYSSMSLASLITPGDQLRVDLFAIPGRHYRYTYGLVAASVPIGGDGWKLGISASAGDNGQRSSGNRIDGRSTNLAAQLSYPIVRGRSLTLVGKVSLNDWRSVGDEDHDRNQRDRLRVARIGLDISNENISRLTGEIAISHGLGFGNMTRVGDPLASRPDAGGRFTKAAFTVQLSHPLSDRVTVQGIVAGQISDRPLLSAEEFALGGNRLGRAFDFNEVTGDRGAAAGLELAYRLDGLKNIIDRLELFGFVDAGVAGQNGSNSGLPKSRSLASAGVGSRFSMAGISFSAEIGVPLHLQGEKKSARGFVSAFKSF